MPKSKNSKSLDKIDNLNYFKILNNDNGNEDNINSNCLSNNKNLNKITNLNKTVNKNDIVVNNIKKEKIMKLYTDDNLNQVSIENFEDDNWLSVKKKQKNFKNKIKSLNNNFDLKFNNLPSVDNLDNLNELDDLDDGLEYKLFKNWNVWTHFSESNNWTPESYKHIFTIDTIKSFWEFFGNIDKLDLVKHQFYIMRDSSGPTWEHPSNRNGGICSIRVIKDRSIEIIEQLAILILNECFSDNPIDINGLSFSLKHNWGVIKIWNSIGSNDLSLQVPAYMIKKYSANPRYEANEPEY